MTCLLVSITLHVPNVWQTCEWYRTVFGFASILATDARAARLDGTGLRLYLLAHVPDDTFGPRRINSFLVDPPALHLHINTPDVAVLFDHALAHGAVPVRVPAPAEHGGQAPLMRGLNGLLIQLVSSDSNGVSLY